MAWCIEHQKFAISHPSCRKQKGAARNFKTEFARVLDGAHMLRATTFVTLQRKRYKALESMMQMYSF